MRFAAEIPFASTSTPHYRDVMLADGVVHISVLLLWHFCIAFLFFALYLLLSFLKTEQCVYGGLVKEQKDCLSREESITT